MSKPISETNMSAAAAGESREGSVSVGRKVLLYATPVISGAALVAVIYFLRLDIVHEWEKSLVDLLMVTVAVVFFVSLYMAADAIIRGTDREERHRSDGR